jgi:hypothetical protein
MISPSDQKLLEVTAEDFRTKLDLHHSRSFGIFPSADVKSNYFNQVWARDAAHATAHYFAREKPEAVIDSLQTLLKYQRQDGSFPFRVEREYQTIKLIWWLSWIGKPLFYVIENIFKKRTERPVHEGQDSGGGEDTIPAILIMAGELFEGSEMGRKFVAEHFSQLQKAAEFFRTTKTDSKDGLAIITRDNADWADTIKRKGKLGLINIWYWRGLDHLKSISHALGDDTREKTYREESEKVREGIMEKLYDRAGGFFRAKVGDTRLDTVATIFGAQYFLSAEDAVHVEETLKQRVEHISGLQNFSPLYEKKDIFWTHRIFGQLVYHNVFVWPWVSLQNIHLKIKIAQNHENETIRQKYHNEAINDLIKMVNLFKIAGGAYEVFEPDRSHSGETKFYKPPQNFMGSMAAYEGAYLHLKKLGWIS